jgi:hypothetical protein
MNDNVIPLHGFGAMDERNIALAKAKQAVIELVEICGLEHSLNADEQVKFMEAEARISVTLTMDVNELKSAVLIVETDEHIRPFLEFKPSVKH